MQRIDCKFKNHSDYNKKGRWEESDIGKRYYDLGFFSLHNNSNIEELEAKGAKKEENKHILLLLITSKIIVESFAITVGNQGILMRSVKCP